MKINELPWYEGELPCLVIGFEPNPDRGDVYGFTDDADDYAFDEKLTWYRIQHQTGGYCCYQRRLVAARLKPRDAVLSKLRQIDKRWLGSQAGCPKSKLSEVLIYREGLRDLFGADCDSSFSRFEEGYYPLDPQLGVLRQLTDDPLPDDLDFLFLVQRKGGARKHAEARSYYRDGWQAVVLGTNSD
jgi:hypothetical protein